MIALLVRGDGHTNNSPASDDESSTEPCRNLLHFGQFRTESGSSTDPLVPFLEAVLSEKVTRPFPPIAGRLLLLLSEITLLPVSRWMAAASASRQSGLAGRAIPVPVSHCWNKHSALHSACHGTYQGRTHPRWHGRLDAKPRCAGSCSIQPRSPAID